jgi:predicted nucleic acid-binding protein
MLIFQHISIVFYIFLLKKERLDTSPLIYFIEENPTYFSLVQPFFKSVHQGRFTVITSLVTLIEVLVHPLRSGNKELASKYRDILFHAKGFTTASLLPEIAEKSAQLRADYAIRTPDAIQLATAIYYKGSFFLTNDGRLPDLPEITILSLDKILKEKKTRKDRQGTRY